MMRIEFSPDVSLGKMRPTGRLSVDTLKLTLYSEKISLFVLGIPLSLDKLALQELTFSF